jgi:hypothetical protein
MNQLKYLFLHLTGLKIYGDGGPIEIKENTATVFATDLLDNMIILIYEVRVTFFDCDDNVLVTSNGLSIINSENVTGQTILDADFRTLDLDNN